jgi:ribosomal protein L11 methyltransferase
MPPVPAFGDGHHPTTRLVAQLLMEAPPRGARVLDLGSGTGLLAIAAWRLGAAAVDASDLDAVAVAASRAVAAANGCPLRVIQSDLLDDLPADAAYDLILANLYGELQEALAAHPRLDAVLPAGRVLLSGISRGKEPAVRAAWERRGFRITDARADGFWCALALARPAAR